MAPIRRVPEHPDTATLWLLNAPVITSDGVFHSRTISVAEARVLAATRHCESAIGHAHTAAAISDLLGIECPMRRLDFRQSPGQSALVFRLARRMEEGRILESRAELEAVGYSFMLLKRLE